MIRINSYDIQSLKDYLLTLGIQESDIACVFIEGSCLYIKEPRDLDILCLTKKDPIIHSAPSDAILVLSGLNVDMNIFSVEQFEKMDFYFPHQFYHEERDYVPIIGDYKAIKYHQLTEENMEREAQSFDDVLFYPKSPYYNPKRLLSLFVLARQMGKAIPNDLLEAAHEERLNPRDYLCLFCKLFPNYSPKVHHIN